MFSDWLYVQCTPFTSGTMELATPCTTYVIMIWLWYVSELMVYSDSVYTGDCIDSLLNLHFTFPYYLLNLSMFPKIIFFCTSTIISVFFCYIRSLSFCSSAAFLFSAAGIQDSFWDSFLGLSVELSEEFDHSYWSKFSAFDLFVCSNVTP